MEVPERSVTPRGPIGFDCHHINNKAIYENKKKLMFNIFQTITVVLFSPIMIAVLYHLYLIEINVKPP